MKNIFSIKEVVNDSSDFIINSKTSVEIKLDRKKQAYISFGSKRHYVNIKVSDSQAEDVVLLSENVINDLYLPNYITYEICVNKNEIILGPFIGLLARNEDDRITEAFLNKMMIYTRGYSEVNGALVVFALDKVDRLNRMIEGYCYNPVAGCWQRGTFPYPSSIYRTIGLSKEWKDHFLSVIGDRFFNSCYFNKRKMYEWFSSVPEVNSHLPHTILYQSHEDVVDMVQRFGKIYIKPVSGLRGHGIVRVSQEAGSLVFKSREGGANQTVTLDNTDEIYEYIKKHFHHKKYLIQQAIDLLEYNGAIVDFRCVLQRNQASQWVFMSMFGRCGQKDSIVSNISSGGTVFDGVDLLRKLLSQYKPDFNSVMKKIENLALNVCSTLDEFGYNFGLLGLDIGVDINGDIWLIEINNRDPSVAYALGLNDEQLYYRLKITPVLYAKSLAGFKE